MSLKSFFCGRVMEVPEEIKKTLIPGEKVLHAVRQARTQQPITPDAIFVTTERVMIRRPSMFGLTSQNRDFRYADMGNVTVHRGILNASISVKMRMLSHNLVLRSIPNEIAPQISRTIQEGIDGRFEGYGEEHRQAYSAKPSSSDDDLLKILKYRYVKGELSKEEYESMKKDIAP